MLLADDHKLILRGVQELLGSQKDMQVVGQEADPTKIHAKVESLNPDILIQDLAMGEVSGIEIIRDVKRSFPQTEVVVLSMHVNVASVWEALEHGAAGYVTKLAEMEELIRAVRAVHRGSQYVGKPLSITDVEEYGRLVRHGKGRSSLLTRREVEVLRMVAQGLTSAEIADRLNIAKRTVESHRANLTSKLRIRNRAELVRYALERGILPKQ